MSPGHDLDGTEDKFHTRVELDIKGNQRAVRDAIEQNGDAQGRIVMRYSYDMLGNRIHKLSMEAGARWVLNDVIGNPIRAWDSRDHEFRTTYDVLRRSTESFLREGTGSDLLVGRSVYGETRPNPETNNLRGKVVQLFDQAGVVTSDDYDFKGNPLSSQRQLAQEYQVALDWSAAVPLEADIYVSRTRFDALNRPTESTAPDNSVILTGYNEANLVESVAASLQGAADVTQFVTNIVYDAKGRRQRIDYGNGASTRYKYDPLTFRLVHLLTQRESNAFPNDCPQPPPRCWHGCQLQNLHYTNDPVGNITHIRDDAQQTIFFRNKRVQPSAEYTYDAIYRLIEATGREHLGQIGGAPIPHSYNDAPRVGIDWSANDGNAMSTYIERYLYDAVGNFLEMQHRGSDPAHPGWTQAHAYDETSLIEDGAGGAPLKISNRLSSTTVGNNNPPVERYVYDAHGNMTRMPHIGGVHPAPNMHWNYRDQLRQTDLGGGGTAYYTYDAAGQRVRKVWEKTPGLVEERIYLGGFEIFRRRNGVGAVTLERETLHIMGDTQRIAMLETKTIDTDNDPSPTQLIRYQFGNHLGSASLELDDQAQIISYEEYTPYGSTSYQAVSNQTETPKRYRYTGKERDEESGLYYHGARYYAAWLGRWTKPDPAGSVDGTNLYMYVRDNPVSNTDSTGRQCDPTIQSCIDPTSSSDSEDVVLQSFPVSTSPVSSPISSAPPGTNFAAEAARARATFRANNPMPEGSQAQHWTKEISARNTNMDPAVMNENMSPLQSRNARPATTLLTDPNGRGTTYTVDNGSTYGNEHKFADRHLIPEIERATYRANPTADPKAVAVDAGRQARWAMTGEPGPEPVPEARATPRFFGPRTCAVINGAVIAGIAGRTITQLHEGKPKEAAKTAVVGAAVYVAIKKVPALLPLVIMKSTIDAYDKEIEEKAFADGDWWESATGSRTVGGLAAAASATGRSAFKGTFGVTGKAIGEGAAAAYIRVTSDKYTLVPWKSQWWADTF